MAAALLILAASLTCVIAQQPRFDVASVKRNVSGDASTTLGFQPGGRFVAVNETLLRLIGEAYAEQIALPPSRIVGGPDWIRKLRFDVDARPETPGPDVAERRRLLQNLLEDRFRLKTHHETRNLPAFALRAARSDGRVGPNLKRSAIDCAALRASGTLKDLRVSQGQQRACVLQFGSGAIGAVGMTLTQLAEGQLTRYVGRPVIDETGLSGPYDWSLAWTPDQTQVPANSNLPSIFTAVREQLGLRLDSHTMPVTVLVIDSAEVPMPD